MIAPGRPEAAMASTTEMGASTRSPENPAPQPIMKISDPLIRRSSPAHYGAGGPAGQGGEVRGGLGAEEDDHDRRGSGVDGVGIEGAEGAALFHRGDGAVELGESPSAEVLGTSAGGSLRAEGGEALGGVLEG